MTTLFISDLHLQPSRPDLLSLFLSFIEKKASQADQLYILGDLFEYWIGDDGSLSDHQPEVAALKALTNEGLPVTVIPGNRDFLLGQDFADETGASLLYGDHQIMIDAQEILILHGDELCTDDVSHQAFRKVALDPAVQKNLLSLPLERRREMASALRAASKAGNKASDIVDVTQHAVEDYLRKHQVSIMVHGHTHRPAIHEFELDGQPAKRIVLTDWHSDHGGYLCVSGGEFSLERWEG